MLFNKTFPDQNETITGIYGDMGEVENELSSSLSVVLNKNGKSTRNMYLKKKVRKTREMKGRGKTRSLLRSCSTCKLLHTCCGRDSCRGGNKSHLVSCKCQRVKEKQASLKHIPYARHLTETVPLTFHDNITMQVIIPSLQMRKLKLRGLKTLIEVDPTSEKQGFQTEV